MTGKDTDRLPEEQRRGISIDLGYAPLDLPGGTRLSVIDVPGHERFVRNMVAGATGIDLFLLVVDAAEGARPQTHEHLAILRLLGIEHGVVAVTKCDAVDAELVDVVVAEAGELVPGAAVVRVSAKTGAGLEELREALAAAADRAEQRAAGDAPTRLFIDRVFTLRGIGTVVTGTLWSGSIREGERLLVAPAGFDVRVRSVQVHDATVDVAEAGQRVAVALPGIERSMVTRGDALVEPGAYEPSYRLDVELETLGSTLPATVQLDHGTSEHLARVVDLGNDLAQLRLRTPIVAARGDRFVLRAGTTVGGGRVLDPAPRRRRDPERLELLRADDPEAVLAATVYAPMSRNELARRRLLAPKDFERGLTALTSAGDWVFSPAWLEGLRQDFIRRLESRAAELEPGVDAPAEPWSSDVVPLLGLERRGSKLYLTGTDRSPVAHSSEAQRVEAELASGAVRRIENRAVARVLEEQGRIVRLGDGYAISAAAFERARDALVRECEASAQITLARFRDLLGTGRRDAQLLLERFDSDGLTRRQGEGRVLRRRQSV